ncbi:MAG: hypothetical protein LBE57_05415 [Methanosarcinales archaeon]|jgi:hypothetical protein|nr:hypothetical protein [Methanosarcinales archaeon]
MTKIAYASFCGCAAREPLRFSFFAAQKSGTLSLYFHEFKSEIKLEFMMENILFKKCF